LLDNELVNKRKILLLLAFSMLFLSSLSNNVYASQEIFSDNFSVGLEKWEAVRGDLSEWTYDSLSKKVGAKITTRSKVIEIAPSFEYWNDLVGDYKVEYDFIALSGIDKNFPFRFIALNKWYEVHHTFDRYGYFTFFLDKVFPLEGGNLAQEKISEVQNLGLRNGDWYHVSINLEGDLIEFCFINLTDNEPINCLINYEDSNTSLTKGRPTLKVGTGSVAPTEIWFDNFLVTTSGGSLDLPFYYEDRGVDSQESFRNAFWDKTNSFFDHNPLDGSFIPFTGVEITAKCISGLSSPLECYNGHNGLDFSSRSGPEVLAAHDGKVVYASDTTPSKNKENCIPKTRGYGCVVVLEHEAGLHTLYAHMREIFVDAEGKNIVDKNTELGRMGATGGAKGVHLHFGALYRLPAVGLSSFKVMRKGNWEKLIRQLETNESNGPVVIDGGKSSCTYTVDGMRFKFVDPSGWEGEGVDPWSEPAPNGCGAENNLLWKYPLN